MSDPNLRGIMVDDLTTGRRPLGSRGGVVEYVTNADGSTSLVGAGGNEFPMPLYEGNTCVIIGDSITAQNLTIDGALGELKAYDTGIYSRTRDKGYMSWLQVISGNRFIPVFNGGASGEKTTEILARLSSALAYNPQWVFELSGTNDAGGLNVTYGGDGQACEDAIYNNRISIWGACKSAGAKVCALAIIPDATTSAMHTAAELGVITRVNRRLRDYALENGIFWVDTQAALTDPAQAAGHGLDSYFDGTVLHPGPYGAYLMAKAIWTQLSGFVQPFSGLVSSQADYYAVDALSQNILPPADGLMQNGTNTTAQTGVTGTFPNASGSNVWFFSRIAGAAATGTINVVASPDGIGNAAELTITSTAAADGFRMLWADGSPSISKIPAGSAVRAEMLVKVTNAVNLRGLQGSILVTTTGGAAAAAYTSMSLESTALTGITDPDGFTGILVTPVINVPSDTTGISLIRAGLQPTFSGAGGAVITLGRVSIRKV